MKEKDEPALFLLVTTLEEIEQFCHALPMPMDSKAMTSRILKKVIDKFYSHQERIFAIKVHEIADWEYEVTVNNVVKATLLLNQKKDPDES